jgi:RHS repeat-associated protein
VSGIGASALWIKSGRSALRQWLALALAIVFVALSGIVVVVQAHGGGSWIQQKMTFLRQLLAAGIWTYFLAEVHRLVSALVSLAAAAAMLIALSKSNVERVED